MKVLLLGCGAMGKTFADSFTQNHTVAQPNLYIVEKNETRCNELRKSGYMHVYNYVGDFVAEVDLIILAVKPQDFTLLQDQLGIHITQEQLVLSIMAGISIESIGQALPGTSKIIRAMPNLPAQIGMGMTGFTAHSSVSRQHLFAVQNLLNTTGKSLYFEREEMLDAVTAISGSGPAYVYFFMDAMIRTAEEMGFTTTQAELLVEQTFLGAVHLLSQNSLSCQEWIQKVSSRGGTTEAAIKVLGETSVASDINEALNAALLRSQELGRRLK